LRMDEASRVARHVRYRRAGSNLCRISIEENKSVDFPVYDDSRRRSRVVH
jgi:hypothetical protein